MADEYILCPKCGNKVPLSKAISAQVDEQVKARSEAEIKKIQKVMDEEYEKRLATERRAAAAKATKDLKVELSGLSEELSQKEKQLEKAQKDELALRKRQRELEEKAKTMELEVARRVDEGLKGVEKATSDRLVEEHRLKDRQKDEQMAGLKRTVEDLQHKLEQGSQQARGEAGEIEVETILRLAFPADQIDPIAKGVRGADVLQTIRSPTGASCGSILWECKAAKNWSDTWLAKLREDQRESRADLAVLVSLTLPSGVNRFGYLDGVWVADFGSLLGLATALRMQLLELQGALAATEGRTTKMELLYTYLSGTDFRQRVEAVVEAFTSMKEDLDRERAAMERGWAKRERQIANVVQNVAGLYGDMQGIIGASLPDIEHLQLPEPPAMLKP